MARVEQVATTADIQPGELKRFEVGGKEGLGQGR